MTNATRAASAIAARPIATALLLGTAAKLIASTSAATSSTESIPPRLSTGSVVSLTWLGTKRSGQKRDDRERERDQEHRAPAEVLEQRAREQRAERGDCASEPDQSAIDFVRAGPDHSAVIRASVVG